MELPRTPSFGLDGKRALATGGTRGIGLGAAVALAEAGAAVTIVARTAATYGAVVANYANVYVLDALKREPKRLRGVAIVKETTTREEVRRMRDAGVAALRFHIATRAHGRFSSLGFEAFENTWNQRAPLGWDVNNPVPAAQACAALLSDWFPATTGEIVHVDGGVHAMGQ